jgi:copper chaperone CopZ
VNVLDTGKETAMKRTKIRLIGGLALLAVTAMGVGDVWAARLNQPTSATPAAGLRVGLNALLSEHVYLAAAATNAALAGRQPEFQAAAAALDANSVDVARAIGSVYGPEAEKAFLPLWRKHIGMVVDYTTGAATNDRAKQEKAVDDLVGYTQDFGAFLSGANPNLPKSVVADLVKHHVLTLKAVIDAQVARDEVKTFAALRAGAGHMRMIADPLAGAIVKQFPDRLAGATDTPAASLRTALNLALREHVYLASAATNAALGGREAEFKAAAGALDANSIAIAKAIGSVYGPDAEKAFLPLWRRHIGMVVDYTVGAASSDRAKQDKAVSELIGYTQDFGAFLAAANPNLPRSVVADLVKHHVVTLKDVIDAQAAKDQGRAFTALRTGAGHMQMIADPLAEAIVTQFPDSF